MSPYDHTVAPASSSSAGNPPPDTPLSGSPSPDSQLGTPAPVTPQLIQLRLAHLRDAMAQHGFDAYMVAAADPHVSEFLSERWKGRHWLSGFTGSAGVLVVTRDFAGLWTDGRYWSQAEAQLAGSGIDLMKIPVGDTALHIDWLAATMPAGSTVGVDGAVLSMSSAHQLNAALAARAIALRTDVDLLDAIWPERPPLPGAPVYEHVAPHATIERAEKLAQLRAAMRAHGANWHFISTLDDIAYLFNLRGADVRFSPVFVAHALIGLEEATLFVAGGKVGPALAGALKQDGVRVAPYEGAAAALAALAQDSASDGAQPICVLLDPRRITFGMRQALPASVAVVEAINPGTLAKSRKTAAEVAHLRATMEQDGAALCEFFAWFEAALGRETITELTIDAQVTAARARRPGFVGPSFATIAAYNANGALPHYLATDAAHATIAGDGLLLIDSGGQYLGGTTDITRVVPVGQVTAAQQRDFTLVLKGHIALARAQFPRGTRGPMLDALARAPIWAAGIDYGHGTGHGVGYFLNVHEGPQVISSSAMPEPHTAIEPGMVTSNEPGVYRPGQWGVRIENLVLACVGAHTDFGEFLRFETLSLCPIDTRCIDLSLLDAAERGWLNDYHATVRARLLAHVGGAARAWLETRTEAI